MDQIVNECARAYGLILEDKQIEAILSSFVQGYDTFVSLPTGYGKSMIYALLPSVFDKIKGLSTSYQLYIYLKCRYLW